MFVDFILFVVKFIILLFERVKFLEDVIDCFVVIFFNVVVCNFVIYVFFGLEFIFYFVLIDLVFDIFY